MDIACCIDPSLCELASRVVKELRHAKQSVVTAESCTGGLIAALLSKGERASDCLHGGFVAYTKAQKMAALGVKAELLEQCSAVHDSIATEMLEGALQRSDATLAVSVTGVLGPDPDEDGNPPGLVYLGICRRDGEPEVIRRTFNDQPPDAVRRAIVVEVLDLLQQKAVASG